MKEARWQRIWYEGEHSGLLLRWLAAAYGGAIGFRAWLYQRGWLRTERVDVPVIVVGNLVAGGAGKTPLTIALVQWLQQRGCHPGVVSRGYGRAGRGPVRVSADTVPSQGGDEPVLIARGTGAPVQVDADRVAAARALVVEAGCDVIVADDGLQHYRLGRDIEIEVLDGVRRYGNGRLLPAGPLREPLARGRRCDFHVVNGGRGRDGEYVMRLRPGEARPLAGGPSRPLSSFAGRRVHAVAGIGNPGRFFATLRAEGIEVLAHPFPDHHLYTGADLHFAESLPLLMTEKDAVKCRDLVPGSGPGQALHDAWAVPVEAQLPVDFWSALAARLAPLMERPA